VLLRYGLVEIHAQSLHCGVVSGEGVLVPAFGGLAQRQANLIQVILDPDQLERVAAVPVHYLSLEPLQAPNLIESEAKINSHGG
jgi:hypothetical protein